MKTKQIHVLVHVDKLEIINQWSKDNMTPSSIYIREAINEYIEKHSENKLKDGHMINGYKK